MPTEDISKVKKAFNDREIRKRAYLKNSRKVNNTIIHDNLVDETKNKIEGLEYFNNLSEGEKIAFQKEITKKRIRESYARYVKYVFQDEYTITKFHAFLLALGDSIVKGIESGKKLRLMISVPPQFGKSRSLTETLPSWFLGRNPDKRCIVTAYNADIAEKFGDTNRQKVKRFGKELFDIEISDSQDNKTLWDIKNKSGGLLATGLNGSLTSNNGALIIVDDPFKSETDALNQTKRDEVWSNFTSSVMTRQRGKGNAVIVIHTRWHEDDLIGRLLKSEVAKEWVYINLPCVWESGTDNILHRKIGETLCPELGFDSKWAESTRKLIGERLWNALYQGKPYSEGGELVKRHFLKFYNQATLPTCFEEITLSADLSFGSISKDSDPNGIGIFGRIGGNHYLIDWWFKKATFTETLNQLRHFCSKYPQMKKKIIEKKANGNSTIETLNKEIGGFVGYDPKGDSKVARLQSVLPYIEAGNLCLPDDSVDKYFESHIQELLKFPKGTHDEIVDIISQYLLNYEYKYGGKFVTDSSFVAIAEAFRGIKI